jgi:hypothetical protein
MNAVERKETSVKFTPKHAVINLKYDPQRYLWAYELINLKKHTHVKIRATDLWHGIYRSEK